jgi:hypothetical protein
LIDNSSIKHGIDTTPFKTKTRFYMAATSGCKMTYHTGTRARHLDLKLVTYT